MGIGVLISTLDDLCTPPSVAELLHVSRPTIYAALRRQRGLEHLRTPGGQIRIRRRDVLAYCHGAGLPVPAGLVPRPPDVVVVHPDGARRDRITQALEPTCRVHGHEDAVDGLIALGRIRPPLAIISQQLGQDMVKRIGRGLHESPQQEYVALLVLTPKGPLQWTEACVPKPLCLAEPNAEGAQGLAEIVEKLLGLA